MSKKDSTKKQLGINQARENWHNYHQDTAFDGTYLRRLPDRTLVPASEYEERLEEYLARKEKEMN